MFKKYLNDDTCFIVPSSIKKEILFYKSGFSSQYPGFSHKNTMRVIYLRGQAKKIANNKLIAYLRAKCV